MNKRAAFQLSVNFLVIMIISIVVFASSIYLINKFFTQAETIKLTYDGRTEKEIERLLDDGSRIAIPFDKKTISNGESKTFGIGILNVLNTGASNDFDINISFNKAFDNRNNEICTIVNLDTCGYPQTWLQTSSGTQGLSEISIQKTIPNNQQEKFLLGVEVKGAPKGTYIFDLDVKYNNNTNWIDYDTLHKLYVVVP
jgi:hypothetical protein